MGLQCIIKNAFSKLERYLTQHFWNDLQSFGIFEGWGSRKIWKFRIEHFLCEKHHMIPCGRHCGFEYQNKI